MKYQVIINDTKETVFTSDNGKYTKVWEDDYYRSLSYKSEKGFLNALNKMINKQSQIRAWNEDGTPNKEFKL